MSLMGRLSPDDEVLVVRPVCARERSFTAKIKQVANGQQADLEPGSSRSR